MKWYHILLIVLFLSVGFFIGWNLKPGCEIAVLTPGKTETTTIKNPVPVKVTPATSKKSNHKVKPKNQEKDGYTESKELAYSDSVPDPCESIREYQEVFTLKDSSKVQVNSIVRGVLERQSISYTPFKITPVKYKPAVFIGLTVGYNNISPAGEFQYKKWSYEVQYNFLTKQGAVGVKRKIF